MLWRQDKRIKEIPEGGGTAKGRTLQGFAFYMTYAEKLTNPKWQKKRLKILERDNWTCQECENTELTLHIHHKRYSGINPWDTDDKYLITLCSKCHSNEEL